MFLRRIFKGIPDVGPWVSIAELLAALATIAATLMAFNVVPNPFGQVSSGIITGTVLDTKTCQPVPEATVQIIDGASGMIVAESVPDAKGSWKETVKPGAYSVKAVCDGYHPSQKSVTVVQDKNRVVRLTIAQRSAEETANMASGQPAPTAQGAPPAPASAPTRTVVVHVPSRPAASSPAAASGSKSVAASAASGGGQTDKLIQQASDLYGQDRKQDALDVLARAAKHDPSDGRLYAKLILLNLELGNMVDAKDWATEGKQKTKKNRGELDKALLELQ